MRQACKLIELCDKECMCKSCIREKCYRREFYNFTIEECIPISTDRIPVSSDINCASYKSFTDKIRRRIRNVFR